MTMNLKVALLAWMLQTELHMSMSSEETVCHSVCKCSWQLETTVRQIKCTNPHIVKLPALSTEDLQRRISITITGTRLTLLPEKSFKNMEIISANFSNNEIKDIDLDAFKNCRISASSSTESFIDFSKNLIRSWAKGTLKYLDGISTLVFASNDLRKINNGMFDGLSSVTKLLLNDNRIERIENEALKGLVRLRTLSLKGNCLTSLADLPRALTSIDISTNLYEKLFQNSFNNVRNTRVLNISNNKLKAIQKNTFSDLKNIAEIDASKNNIRTLEQGAFAFANELTLVNVRENCLESIPKTAFSEFVINIIKIDYSLNPLDQDSWLRKVTREPTVLNCSKQVGNEGRCFGDKPFKERQTSNKTISLNGVRATVPLLTSMSIGLLVNVLAIIRIHAKVT